jgi:hypothetical protein
MSPVPNWRSIPSWCLGANNRFGTCFFAMFGNWLALHTGEIMPDGEVENAAREMEGFNPYDRATDHGEMMQAGIDYILANGWPGDPTLKPARVDGIDPAGVVAAVQRYGCGFAGLALPPDQDFSDAALSEQGTEGHAVFVVEATPDQVTFITWAYPQTVSMAWWLRFARQLFGPVWAADPWANKYPASTKTATLDIFTP